MFKKEKEQRTKKNKEQRTKTKWREQRTKKTKNKKKNKKQRTKNVHTYNVSGATRRDQAMFKNNVKTAVFGAKSSKNLVKNLQNETFELKDP